MMKHRFVAALAVTAGVVLAGPVSAEENMDALKGEAKGLVKMFFGELKGELMGAVKAGGPAHAIGVCSEKAPEIANGLAEKSGWRVARTSLKLRQPGNQADAWEASVLRKFDQMRAEGADPATMAAAKIVERDGKKVFRFMKAIPTAKLCLNCHGQSLDPKVDAALNELYPDDKARGYTEGQIRGAFTLEKPL